MTQYEFHELVLLTMNEWEAEMALETAVDSPTVAVESGSLVQENLVWYPGEIPLIAEARIVAEACRRI